MAFAEVEDPSRERRKRRGRLLGILGLVMLFGPALSIRFVPAGWGIYLIVLMAFAVGILVLSYFLVR